MHLSAEWAVVNAAAEQNLPTRAFSRWETCRSGHTFQAYFQKQLVVYQIQDGKPVTLKALSCLDLNVSLNRGVSSIWVDLLTNDEFCVGHTPVELADSCFMWHLQHTTLDMNVYRGRKNLKFNLAYRTRMNPSTVEEGMTYVLELAVYRNQFLVA